VTQSLGLEEVLSALVVAFGGSPPPSGGLGELYEALIAVVPNGSQGHQGFQGSQGTTGTQGAQGFQGTNSGNQGFQGLQGAQGTQGSGGTGPQGAQGHQGVTGTTGNQGPQGVQGATGAQGFQGTQGAGAQGATGAQGNQGFQGTQGSAGAQGSQGVQGATGTGAQGNQGNQGFQGNTGGAQGTQGAQGFQGTQGAGGGAVTLISAQVLGSPAATISFTSISGSFNQLQLVLVARSAKSAESDTAQMQVNSDTGGNYDTAGVFTSGTGSPSNASTIAGTNVNWLVPAANATAGVSSAARLDFYHYAGTTFQKSGLVQAGYIDGVASSADQLSVEGQWAWRNTGAITRIDLSLVGGSNFVTGTAAYLYGIT